MACFQPSSLFHAEFELGPAQACTAIEEARGQMRAGLRASCARNARARIESERLALGRQPDMPVAGLDTQRVESLSSSPGAAHSPPHSKGAEL